MEKQAKQAINEKSVDAQKARDKGIVDGEDLADEDDHSEPFANVGGHRFENLIKSMLARIEIKGNLAPIQEYGRHQTAAAKKRKDNKKNKAKDPAEGEPNPNESSDNKPLYDDKYYDLDDGFIDDDEIVEDEGFGAELGEGASNFYS